MMKTITLIILMALPGCEDEQPMIRKEAIAETAKNAGDAVQERFLRTDLEFALRQVAICRRCVSNAETAQELALAVEDLRQANEDVARIERELKAVR